MKIYIIRHTEVENPLSITLRRKPGFHLSERGRKQAQIVGNHIISRNISIQRIFSSPMERCIETADIIKTILDNKRNIEIKNYLNEWEVGERTQDIANRVKSIIKDAQNDDLFISHQDIIRVFINLLNNQELRNTELDCDLGSLYEIELCDKSKQFSGYKLLYEPK